MKLRKLYLYSIPGIFLLAGCSTDPSVINARNELRSMNTPFTAGAFNQAVSEGDIEKVNLFIQGKISMKGIDGTNPLLTAVNAEKLEVAKTLIENGVNVDTESDYGTPLCVACAKGYKDIAEYLISEGADVDYLKGSISPLLLAAAANRKEIVKMLIKEGADIDIEGEKTNFTPLIMAAKNGNTDIVKILLKEGAYTDTMDYTRKTALDYAVLNGDKPTAYELLKEDSFDSTEDSSIDSFALAISLKEFEIAQKMIDAGIDVNSKFGDIPLLSWAIYNGYSDGAEFLIESGADLNMEDNQARIPLDYALMKQDKKIIDLIRTKSAYIDKK
jgi:ankyrin repeat protein